jgi:hypothetical protein
LVLILDLECGVGSPNIRSPIGVDEIAFTGVSLEMSTPSPRTNGKFHAIWIVVLLLMITVVVIWWVQNRPAPLTAAEQPFVGSWARPAPIPIAGTTDETLGCEFRADRVVLYHRRNTITGQRTAVDTGIRWRSVGDQFFYTFKDPQLIIGHFKKPLDIEMQVAWDGNDRLRLATVHYAPDGRPSIDEFSRVKSKADSP